MFEITIAFMLGGTIGIVIMALMNAASRSETEIHAYRLYICLKNLLNVCYYVENLGDLPPYTPRIFLENAQHALDEFNERTS